MTLAPAPGSRLPAVGAAMILAATANAQSGSLSGPYSQLAPREIVVIPRHASDSRAVALEMAAHGFQILARGPVSGVILAATAIGGTEWICCQWLKTWPAVQGAEQCRLGHAMDPVFNCPYTAPTPDACAAAYPLPLVDPTQTCPQPPVGGLPNDPAACWQWWFKNTGQAVSDRTDLGLCWNQVGIAGVDINVLPAWEFTTGSPLVTVAVLDSGVEYCNPDFDPERFLYPDMALTCIGYEGYDYPCCPEPPGPGSEFPCNYGPARDNKGHGTIIASIIGAEASNGVGIAGIDQQCRILSGRVFGLNGAGTGGVNVALVNATRAAIALEWIASAPEYRSVRVINLSFGAALPQDSIERALFENAVNLVVAQNRFVVAAAGNGGSGDAVLAVPAAFANVFTVGGIDARGRRVAPPHLVDPLGAGTSATGSSLDFTAPGMGIVADICQSNPCPYPAQCSYQTFECEAQYHKNFVRGTSFAAPQVAGAISLLLAEAIDLGVVNPTPATNPETWPGLNFVQMYELLRAGARDQVSDDPLDTPDWDPYYGWGLIDIAASICELHDVYGAGCP